MADFNKLSADEIVKRCNLRAGACIIAQILCLCEVIVVLILLPVRLSAEIMVILITALIFILLLIFYSILIYSLDNILFKGMDPQKHITVWSSLKFKRYIRYIGISPELKLAEGLYYGGSTQKAIEHLDAVKECVGGDIVLLLYFNMRFICNVGIGNYTYIDELLLMLQTIKNKSRMKFVKKYADSIMDLVNREMLYYKGEYTAYEQSLLEVLESEKHPFNKVISNYRLAKLYFETSDYEKSKYRCRYVIENGNKLFVVQKAKEMMEKMG